MDLNEIDAAVLALPGAMNLAVQPTGWGSVGGAQLQRVLDSIRDVTLSLVPSETHGDMPKVALVEPSEPFPIYYDMPTRNFRRIGLQARGPDWPRYAYQLSHEIGHAMCNGEDVSWQINRFHWLDEAICGAVSLSVLPRMETRWGASSNPDWREHAISFMSYYGACRSLHGSLNGRPWSDWHHENRLELASTRALVTLNFPLSTELHLFFDEKPERWGAIRYLNTWGLTESEDLREHLSNWRAHCHSSHAADAVRDLAERIC